MIMNETVKEIGGYFGLEPLISHEYYPELIALNSARNALVFLAKLRGIKKFYLPVFLCEAVDGVLEREGIAYEYYHVGADFLPRLEENPSFKEKIGEDERLYIVNYYGQLTEEMLMDLQNTYGSIVVDNVQAFFTPPMVGTDTIYTCRKFFGVPDGAYVSLCAETAEMEKELPELETDISMDRMGHVLGRFEGSSASDYYGIYTENEDKYADMPLKAMSKLTHNILGAIDYEKVKTIREENFRILHEALGTENRLNIHEVEGPYAYPFYCENAPAIRKLLAKEKIFVATLWPNVLGSGDEAEKDLAANILPLPVDQRCGKADMERLLCELKKAREAVSSQELNL